MNDADQIVVAANGTVYVAPVGTTQPTDPTSAPAAAWVDLGYITEDGATFTDSKEIEDILAWQSFYPVRKIVTGKEASASFALRQWNENSIPLAFGGGSVTNPSTGVWRYVPPNPEDLDERALMIDWQDGDKNYRLIIPKGLVTEAVETQLVRTGSAELPITFAAVPASTDDDPFVLITDDLAFSS
jgi:hypothetical protein